MKAIGVAGTAKNTGKTTTLAAILEELSQRNVKLGLTSIGYDGERVDNVTGLPKPRITMSPGDWIATADSCLDQSSARARILERTQIHTPLGRLVIGQIDRRGSVILAGPNKTRELQEVLQRLAARGVELALVDGALNRLVPMAATSGFILATGAARHQDISILAGETAVIEQVAGYPASTLKYQTSISVVGSKTTRFPFGSILGNDQVDEVRAAINQETRQIVIPGIIGEKQLEYLAAKITNWYGLQLVLSNPFNLLVSANLPAVAGFLKRVYEGGGWVQVINRVPLLAVTVNPFFPRFRYRRAEYEPAYVNAAELFSAMEKCVTVPVINVRLEGARELVNTILGSEENK